MMRIFLIGMLCGVMLAAAFTYAFAIPANSYHWQMEIWKRGDAAFTVDKNGHGSWKWLVALVKSQSSLRHLRQKFIASSSKSGRVFPVEAAASACKNGRRNAGATPAATSKKQRPFPHRAVHLNRVGDRRQSLLRIVGSVAPTTEIDIRKQKRPAGFSSRAL